MNTFIMLWSRTTSNPKTILYGDLSSFCNRNSTRIIFVTPWDFLDTMLDSNDGPQTRRSPLSTTIKVPLEVVIDA